MRHITILVHPHDDFAGCSYLLQGVADEWRQSGTRVTVVRDPLRHLEADMAILHADVTVVPDEYLQFMRRYPLTINAGVKDISKRTISAHLVHDGDGYKGPVLVKTNRNCGGASEALHAQHDSWLKRKIRSVRSRLHWSWRASIDMWDYRVFPSPDRVPLPVWFNPDLVVERFLPERRDGCYCLRTWIFLGDAEENLLFYANQPIVKSPVAVRIEKASVPDELREMRRKLGFDFGKFDYGMVDGKVVLYDVNRTPVARPARNNTATIKLLAAGVESLFKPRYRAAG
jgi:hypothetical protein